MRRGGLILWMLAAPLPLAAQNISLTSPIGCDLQDVCFIQQYTDRDPTTGVQDFTCGALTYDGHKGTDFALPDWSMIADNIPVLAAADGVVAGVRNDMPDILQGQPGAPVIDGNDCGNGLVINHGDGWETQYCHMKRGSLAVQPGQRVTQGELLGNVGQSGRSEFAHLHLSVRHDGTVVDPFDADDSVTCGTAGDASLWSVSMPMRPGGLVSVGFSNAVPDFDTIRFGAADTAPLATNAPALVLWGYLFGGRDGDQIRIMIDGPDGPVFDDTQVLNRTQAQLFRAGGKRTPGGGWSAGDYIGTVMMIRDGDVLETLTKTIALD